MGKFSLEFMESEVSVVYYSKFSNTSYLKQQLGGALINVAFTSLRRYTILFFKQQNR